jgi:DHA3 family tetracycline resistance protein-like MFS transporter
MPLHVFRLFMTRPRRSENAVAVYLLLTGGQSLFFSMVVTLNLVYQATIIGLSPFQMVFVGTVLETVFFLGEIPTGVVADIYSRRLSIIIGILLIGCGFTLEGARPTFAAVLAAQALLGIGWTFTSGAIAAWITDEVGDERVGLVFLRGTQIDRIGAIVGILLSAGFGMVGTVQLPVFLGGLGFVLLGGVLALTMPERNFHRTPVSERSTWHQMRDTLREGIRLARRRPVVRTLVLVSLVAGLASEAFDRLWTVHVLADYAFPALFGSRSPALWFGLIALAGSLLGLLAAEVVRRFHPEALHRGSPARLLAGMAAAQVATTLLFAVAGSLWMALSGLWIRQIAGTVMEPVSSAWMNRNLEARTRATVLSLESQANAFGQIGGGPALGWVGSAVSVRAALIGSALVFSPVVALYGHAMDHSGRADMAQDERQVVPVVDEVRR